MNDAEIIAKAQAEHKRRQAVLALQKAQEAEKLRLQDATAHDAAERVLAWKPQHPGMRWTFYR